jgi:hypothetical protein
MPLFRKTGKQSNLSPENLDVFIASPLVRVALEATNEVSASWREYRAKVDTEQIHFPEWSPEVDWIINVEMVCYLLHLVDRSAFSEKGANVRDRLMDATIPHTFKTMIEVHWNVPETRHSSPDLQDRALASLRLVYNDSAVDYSNCSLLFDQKADAMKNTWDETTVLGKLSGRIVRSLELEGNPLVRSLVWIAGFHTLKSSVVEKGIAGVVGLI